MPGGADYNQVGTGYGAVEPNDATRIGSVETDHDLAGRKREHLLQTVGFQEMLGRMERAAELIERYSHNQEGGLSDLLNLVLEDQVSQGKLEAMLLASDQGLTIVNSESGPGTETMATLAAMFDSVVARIRGGEVMSDVSELSLRGNAGEMVIVRRLPIADEAFFLIGYASTQVPYRMVMNRCLKQCTSVLRGHFGWD